jgi:hypothetical protein
MDGLHYICQRIYWLEPQCYGNPIATPDKQNQVTVPDLYGRGMESVDKRIKLQLVEFDTSALTTADDVHLFG